MPKYIGKEEARAYNPTLSGEEDVLVIALIEQAEAVIDSYLVNYDFSASTITAERHDYNDVGPYYLQYTPTAITHFTGNAVTLVEGTDYIRKGRRIMFADSVVFTGKYNETFDYIEFTYTKDATIPQNVKTATLLLMNEIFVKKNSMGISEFTQGDLSITYKDGGFGGNLESMYEIRKLLSPFKNVNVVS